MNRNEKLLLDKELASEISKMIKADPELGDESAGWHIIVGKSFAASLTYHTKYLIYIDLLEPYPKSFLLFKTV